MGRYYSGDINGKFWFGLQSSDAASRFGGEELEPSYISYHFNEDHLDEVNEEIKFIEEKLGDNKKIIDDFFNKKDSYSNKDLEDINISQAMLSDYADLSLGIQIRDCIVENGDCNFDADL